MVTHHDDDNDDDNDDDATVYILCEVSEGVAGLHTTELTRYSSYNTHNIYKKTIKFPRHSPSLK